MRQVSRPKKVRAAALKPHELLLKAGFTDEDIKVIQDVYGPSEAPYAMNGMASLIMPLKITGYTMEQIREGLPVLEKSMTNKAAWKKVWDLLPNAPSVRIAFLAYRAGFSAQDIIKVDKTELTEDNLRTMIMLIKL